MIFKTLFNTIRNYHIFKKYGSENATKDVKCFKDYLKQTIKHQQIYKTTYKTYKQVNTGYKDKFDNYILEGDKLKITDNKGEHFMVMQISPASYPNQETLWSIEAIPPESGPGYWYELPLQPYVKKDKEFYNGLDLKPEQIEKIGSIYNKT